MVSDATKRMSCRYYHDMDRYWAGPDPVRRKCDGESVADTKIHLDTVAATNRVPGRTKFRLGSGPPLSTNQRLKERHTHNPIHGPKS
jgi:hypothetical protein